jgi:predicted N-acetyltransferase YhbS
VSHEAQGKGAGRALIAGVVAEARARGLQAVTLTTFRDIPWNAPFYARCGFVEVPEAEFGSLFTLVREREIEAGLDAASRCAMRLRL